MSAFVSQAASGRAPGEQAARSALALVFDAWAVDALRQDSPLAALGASASDCACIASAVEDVCGVVLSDPDAGALMPSATLADLASALGRRLGGAAA